MLSDTEIATDWETYRDTQAQVPVLSPSPVYVAPHAEFGEMRWRVICRICSGSDVQATGRGGLEFVLQAEELRDAHLWEHIKDMTHLLALSTGYRRGDNG